MCCNLLLLFTFFCNLALQTYVIYYNDFNTIAYWQLTTVISNFIVIFGCIGNSKALLQGSCGNSDRIIVVNNSDKKYRDYV